METVLIVEDNKDMQFILSNILKDEGYKVSIAEDGKRALKEIERCNYNLVLLDIRLPGMDGMQILDKMKEIDKDLSIIMLTAYGDVKGAVKAVKLGAFDYITKPFDNEELILVIKKALNTQYLSKEVKILRKQLGERIDSEHFMGESAQIKRVLNQVNLVLPTDMTVILQGESGTGKELIAQMIHQRSSRKDKSFVAIDCGAIPETLVESEFFGYEKGAFTGADERKEGKLEQANGGTFFLDEITNLSDTIQMKFLRVVQERKVRRLGGKQDIEIDVRIIVATNFDLAEAVTIGRFRDDLFHRLNEFCINLPPMREIKGDIPILAHHFLKEANKELNKNIKGFSSEVMAEFFNYHWPGNVRELKNAVRRGVLLTESEYVMPNHLSLQLIKPETGIKFTPFLEKGDSLKETMRKLERDLIVQALKQVNHNRVKASELLQVNRKALYRKMKSLEL